MFPLDRLRIESVESSLGLGVVGLALGATVGAWFEYLMLRRHLKTVLGDHAPGLSFAFRLLGAGGLATLAGVGAKMALGSAVPAHLGIMASWMDPDSPVLPFVLAVGTALTFGVVYLVSARVLGVYSPSRSTKG